MLGHLHVFCSEVDKLAKKAGLPSTPFVVEQINDIIRDSKTIVSGDPYLDRVKEWALGDV